MRLQSEYNDTFKQMWATGPTGLAGPVGPWQNPGLTTVRNYDVGNGLQRRYFTSFTITWQKRTTHSWLVSRCPSQTRPSSSPSSRTLSASPDLQQHHFTPIISAKNISIKKYRLQSQPTAILSKRDLPLRCITTQYIYLCTRMLSFTLLMNDWLGLRLPWITDFYL